jgi:cation diffusion facilitator CzcD-associated flavoprotein CzcO
MDTETFGVKTNEHIPGTVVNRYLKAYAAKFGIADFIRLQTKVSVAEHQGTAEGGWVLTVVDAKQQESKLFARRLVLATGRTSDPFLPHFAGQETFGGRVFHGKQFLENRDTLQTAKAVTVFGASKSAWDAVYAYATAGVKVNWIIRRMCCSQHRTMNLESLLITISNRPWTMLDVTSIRDTSQTMD